VLLDLQGVGFEDKQVELEGFRRQCTEWASWYSAVMRKPHDQ
jgi:hypothetical protein